MTTREFYELISGNYEEALKRMMKEALVHRFIMKFPNDPSFGELESALQAGAVPEAFRAAHTLKGVCMNLAFTRLGGVSSQITEMLRGEDLSSAKAFFPTLRAEYEKTLFALKQLESE